MKSWLLLFCTMVLPVALLAQPKLDKGAAAIAVGKEDTAYIDALNKKSIEGYLYRPDSSRAMAEKALILATQAKYQRGQGVSFAAIGYSYWAQSYFSVSLYYLFNALEYLNHTDDYAELSMCNRIIARNYIEMANYSLAASYLKAAEANAALSKDNFKIELVYNESSLLDIRQKNYSQAWTKCKTGLSLCFKNKDTLLTGIIYSRLANILKQTQQNARLKNYYDTAYYWSQLAKNSRLRALLLNHYAEYYLSTGRFDSALHMAGAASRLAGGIGNMELKLMAADIVVRVYHTAKDTKNELAFSKNYNTLQDSIRGAEKNNNFQLLQQFFALNTRLRDIDEREHGEVVNKARVQSQHIVITVLVLFIAILLAGLLTIYYLYNEKKRLADELARRNNAAIEQKNIIEEQSRHLTQLNDLKTKLFAVISHDLRTPISSLRSIVSMFQQHDLTEEQAIALLKRMLPALDGADLTLSNLLNWSVKQMNGLKVNKSNIAILPLAEEVQQVFEFALQQKNITLAVNISENSRAFVDDHHLKIILRNLVSNAIKFTPQNGCITIAEKNGNGKTTICVTDTGQGINADNLAKLFVPTINFTTRGTAGEKGTGLGLVLCKELLDLNNGRIYVESTPGAGSTFYIEIQEKEG